MCWFHRSILTSLVWWALALSCSGAPLAVSLASSAAGRSLRFALLTIGGLALLALLAIGIGALARMRSMAGTRVFRIPPVDLPERLGAPCGGSVTSRSFRPKE
jgi:hypothetical protein